MNEPEAGHGPDVLDVAAAPNAAEKHRRYRAMVERFRELVARTVPPTARVAVVSKGDDELLRLGARVASHFPPDPNGGYAGYHPASGPHALEMLQASRAHGVEYLLFPATSLWWRETYDEFGQYLATRYRLLTEEDGTGAIYHLIPRTSSQPVEPPLDEEVAQIQELVRAVLPDDARIGVLADGVGARCTFSRWMPAGLDGSRGTEDPLPAALEGLESIRKRADFLVVPAQEERQSSFRVRLLEAIAEQARPVLEQRHVCAIFDLRDGERSVAPAQPAEVEDVTVVIAHVGRLLLPRDAAVVLAGSEHETCARLDQTRLVRVVLDAHVDADALLARLKSWRAGGAEYLVVTPRALLELDPCDDTRLRLDALYACRWSDLRCLVYDLTTARRQIRRAHVNGRSAG